MVSGEGIPGERISGGGVVGRGVKVESGMEEEVE